MDKIQAKEKINKLLRLANDKGATPSERDTALEMANKLASKFGMKIQKSIPSTRIHNNQITKIRYEFDLNCFNKKFVSFLFRSFRIEAWYLVGKKTVIFDDCRNFNVDEFKKFYKKFVSVYYNLKKKELDLSERDFFDSFCYYFTKGVCNYTLGNPDYTDAYNLGILFHDTKFL